MKRISFAVALVLVGIPTLVNAQKFAIGLAGGVGANSLPKVHYPNQKAHQAFGGETMPINAAFQITGNVNFSKWQAGAFYLMQNISRGGSSGARSFLSDPGKIAGVLFNRKFSIAHVGVNAGYVFSDLATGQPGAFGGRTKYGHKAGYSVGAQAGISHKLTSSLSLGLEAQVRYARVPSTIVLTTATGEKLNDNIPYSYLQYTGLLGLQYEL